MFTLTELTDTQRKAELAVKMMREKEEKKRD